MLFIVLAAVLVAPVHHFPRQSADVRRHSSVLCVVLDADNSDIRLRATERQHRSDTVGHTTAAVSVHRRGVPRRLRQAD